MQSHLPFLVPTHPIGQLYKNPSVIACNNVIMYTKLIPGIKNNIMLNIINVIIVPIIGDNLGNNFLLRL